MVLLDSQNTFPKETIQGKDGRVSWYQVFFQDKSPPCFQSTCARFPKDVPQLESVDKHQLLLVFHCLATVTTDSRIWMSFSEQKLEGRLVVDLVSEDERDEGPVFVAERTEMCTQA